MRIHLWSANLNVGGGFYIAPIEVIFFLFRQAEFDAIKRAID